VTEPGASRNNRVADDVAKRDFYETLGVARTASDAELKAAFRKAAMQCHPDRHPGDKQAETRFKEINEAYQHLSDSQKRAAYDRYGHAAFESGGGMSEGFAASMSDIFDDLFGDIMGRRGSRSASGKERGADLRYSQGFAIDQWSGLADAHGAGIDASAFGKILVEIIGGFKVSHVNGIGVGEEHQSVALREFLEHL
jgi:curved DNA-binding protein CbpA